MDTSERVIRRRQITQDFMHMSDVQAAFALDGTVRALQSQEVDVGVKLESRVEGRFRTATVKQRQLGEIAIYRSFPELLISERQRVESLRNGDSWTIEDIPADVRAECDAWMQEHKAAIIPDLQVAAREILQTPVDRMMAKEPCPHCKYGDARYACRSSGWDREVYSYPLMRLQDETTGEIHEVPFDAALYIDAHSAQRVTNVMEVVDNNDRLSATLELGIMSEGVSAEYVARATEGRIQPKSPTLSVALDRKYLQRMRRALAHWKEPGALPGSHMPAFTKLLNEDGVSSQLMIVELQNAAVEAYAERVTDVDYNQLFQSVRQNLGAKGLLLAFGWHHQGQGESEASYQIFTPRYERIGGWSDMDAYEALTEFAKRIDTAAVMTSKPRISGE